MKEEPQEDRLLHRLQLLDPLIQFLTKSTGLTSVPLSLLGSALPKSVTVSTNDTSFSTPILEDLQELDKFGVLTLQYEEHQQVEPISWKSRLWKVGFPGNDPVLRASTKTAAKKRLAKLKRILKPCKKSKGSSSVSGQIQPKRKVSSKPLLASLTEPLLEADMTSVNTAIVIDEKERQARDTVAAIFGEIPKREPDQKSGPAASEVDSSEAREQLYDNMAYAGSHPAQEADFVDLSPECRARIPDTVWNAFGLSHQRLYRHQARAIESALVHQRHTAVCTGTGSGKSLCFWLPIIATSWNNGNNGTVSLVLFPTKALAQDQLTKLQRMLQKNSELHDRVTPATLDGDTPQSTRSIVMDSANIVLTNPDTLHACILPSASSSGYSFFLERIQYIVLDEAHVYSGTFGAHVGMILRRLFRVVHSRGNSVRRLTFLAASATLPHPGEHFRRLCPIAQTEDVEVISEDASPRAAKHFFIQNPPLFQGQQEPVQRWKSRKRKLPPESEHREGSICGQHNDSSSATGQFLLRRRHAADETALLLAHAVTRGVRCIAFCRTRNIVEWVFDKARTILKRKNRDHLLESYRGGYTMKERRDIEAKLFSDKLVGVVATNALELGVDVGGVDVTLHCGYPSSYASLLQQAGRAGRGANRSSSLSIMVCFNSPEEQHIWRHPTSLLYPGISSMSSVIPYGSSGLVQGHLLCAANEVPLVGAETVRSLACCSSTIPSDWELFGGKDMYQSAERVLVSAGSVIKVDIPGAKGSRVPVLKAHSSMRKAWSRVSIRSIEPISYAIVNLSHPKQAGQMDAIYDEGAILDTVPYSRVFYHAHPGAIITHRGAKYKVTSMMRPPVFVESNFASVRRGMQLAAFARPTREKYITRPLSNLLITVVKQLETVQLEGKDSTTASENRGTGSAPIHCCTIAGCGTVSIKRTVHGYKKLSLITRAELSRTELSLPPMEYDTFGVWLDAGANQLKPELGDNYGEGVHALCHAILAVAPRMIPGLCRSDLQCDHTWLAPTLVMLFDHRPGGSGVCQSLWKHIFKPNNLIKAAIELLECCSVCSVEATYDGGCPECLHDANCIRFNMNLSRSAAIVVGKWIQERIEKTEAYKAVDSSTTASHDDSGTPQKARAHALKAAKVQNTMQVVVGRPSWPLDGAESGYVENA